MNIKYKPAHYFTLSHPLLGSGFRNYVKLLLNNFWRIDPRFSLKLVFSFVTMLVWSPLRWFESLILFRKIRRTEVKAPIIVLGHPRSGTTYLHYLLAADPALAYSNTYEVFMPRLFYFFGKYIGKMMDPLMPKKRAMDNLSMGAYKPTMDEFALANLSQASWCHGFYFPNRINHYFSKYVIFENGDEKDKSAYKKAHLYFAKKAQLQNPGKTLILKSAATTCRIKELLEIFPDARFVHIHRHPDAVYRSTERLYEKILPMFGFHKVTNSAIESFIISSYRAYHKKWFQEKELIPQNRLVEFPFEDFVKQPVHYLQQCYQKFGITMTTHALAAIQQVVNNHNAYQKNSYLKLPEDKQSEIHKKWGFCYEAWGYTF